jgi:hypothetical protein
MNDQPLVKQIIRAPEGSARCVVALDDVQVPDLWHIAQAVHDKIDRTTTIGRIGLFKPSDAILECWHLCHDLLNTLRGDPRYKV